MNRDIVRQILVLLALAVTLAVNFIAEALPLNGLTSAQIANRLPILFVPANYVFGIWGLIYTFLIGFAIYQALPSQRENPTQRRIGYWFILTCAANAVWLILFHYEQFPLSMLAMIVLLGALLVIYHGALKDAARPLSHAARWLLHVPFSIYLGWISVATIANAAYVLYDLNWDGLGISGAAWAVIMLIVAAGITLEIIRTRHDIAFTAVILWAYIGIVVKQIGTPPVALTAGALAAALAAFLVISLIRRTSDSGTLSATTA